MLNSPWYRSDGAEHRRDQLAADDAAGGADDDRDDHAALFIQSHLCNRQPAESGSGRDPKDEFHFTPPLKDG